MTPEEMDFLRPLVDGVAREFSRRYWKTAQVEFADVEQECWVWCIKHPGKVSEWVKTENGHRPLRTSLRNVALTFCQKEKAQRLGYEASDLFYWSKGDVEVALGAMFDRDAWLSPPQSEGRSNKSAAEGGNYIATLADLSRAFDQLPQDDRNMLELYYRHEWRQADIGAYLDGISQAAVSQRIDRAVKRLSDILGGPAPRQGAIHDYDSNGGCECGKTWRDGPGTRKALSGAAARAITSHSYDGEDA